MEAPVLSDARLEGKTALVSGIGSGIGRATALLFARQGATVIGTDIDAEGAEATAHLAADEGLAMESLHPFDLREPDQVEELIGAAEGRYGGFNVLVNAAARFVGAPIEDMDFDEHWRGTLASELDGVFLICQAAWPHLRAAGGSSIVNFASINARMAARGLPTLVHAAGKAGVLGMSRELAKEGAPHSIRANTISPGLVVTNATRRFLDDDPELTSRLTERTMLGRLGQPEDVAWAALFLASDESSWITGADLAVDGGWTAW